MEGFRMELHAPGLLTIDLICGILHLGGRCDAFEIGREGGDGVAVAHPHLRVVRNALEKGIIVVEAGKIGPAVFTESGRFNLATVGLCHILRAIAYTQERVTPPDDAQVRLESGRIIDAVRRAGENDADDRRVIFRKFVVRQDFAESVKFPQTSSDQLGGL